MNSLSLLCSLLAQQAPAAPAAGANPPGGGSGFMIMMILMVVIFWVLTIRPQQKRQKEHNARVAALKKGDRVVIAGGIHGIVEATRDQTLSVKIAEGVRVDVERAAVSAILSKDEPAPTVPVEVAKNGK